jgi:hypothetical protein
VDADGLLQALDVLKDAQSACVYFVAPPVDFECCPKQRALKDARNISPARLPRLHAIKQHARARPVIHPFSTISTRARTYSTRVSGEQATEQAREEETERASESKCSKARRFGGRQPCTGGRLQGEGISPDQGSLFGWMEGSV